MANIDTGLWRRALSQPDWYIALVPDFRRIENLSPLAREEAKETAYSLIQEALIEGILPIANTGPDEDQDRQPIDTIVIHHTKNKPGLSLSRLNAMQLLRLYGQFYYDCVKQNTNNAGGLVWSGHFFDGSQVFWCYHHFVSADGVKRILQDKCIGWHAGDWSVNTRSVAICIDDDFSNKEPTDYQLRAVAKVISKNYSHLSPKSIIGHKEVNPERQLGCPVVNPQSDWKRRLLGYL